MRVTIAAALFAFGLAGVTAASAADIPVGHSAGEFSPNGVRSAMLVSYDSDPGIVVRAYWLAPWRNHHYFPFTGKRPRIGRKENLSAVSHPKPAKTFRRSWSNAWAFDHSLAQPAAAPTDVLSLDGNAESSAPPSMRHMNTMKRFDRLRRRRLAPSH